MEHDFEKTRRGAVIKDAGKTRVTMYIDNDVLEYFRAVATQKGRGYQTEINGVLRDAMMGKGVSESRPRSDVSTGRTGAGMLTSQLDQLVDRLDRLEQHVGLSSGYVGGTYPLRLGSEVREVLSGRVPEPHVNFYEVGSTRKKLEVRDTLESLHSRASSAPASPRGSRTGRFVAGKSAATPKPKPGKKPHR